MPRIRADSIEAHKEITRSAILDAAEKVFLTFGYSGASIATIADLAGIARTTVYEYHPNKETVLLAVLKDRVPPLMDCLVDSLPDLPVHERMEMLFRGAFQLTLDHPDLTALLFRVGRELPKPERDQMWHTLDRVTGELYRLCSVGLGSGVYAATSSTTCGRAVADLLVGGIDELSQHDDVLAAAPAILAERLVFMRQGLGVGRAGVSGGA
jgi:AcrR family transcriptional regulator